MESPQTKAATPALSVRACLSTYAVLAGIFGLLLVFCLALALAKPARGAWQSVAIVAAVFTYVIVWIAAFRLKVADGILSYRSLFGGVRSLGLDEIQLAEIKIDFERKFGPPLGLLITPRSGCQKPKILVNMKVFGKEDLHKLFDILGPALKGNRKLSILGRD